MAKTSGLQVLSTQTTDVDGWVGRETAGCQFGDKRLDKRFTHLVEYGYVDDDSNEGIRNRERPAQENVCRGTSEG